MTADLTPAQAARPSCPFCAIIDGSAPAEIVGQWGEAIAITPVRKIERVMVPVVHAVVADELRAAADWYWDDHGPGRMVHDDLKRRADALDPR
jgi:hypothetical protein